MSRLSQMLTHRQKQLGLTDRQVCEPRGWTQQTYSTWKRGTIPRLPVHKALAEFLRIDRTMLEELVDEARESTGNTKIPVTLGRAPEYGKVSDRKTGKFRFAPHNDGRWVVPEGRHSITIDTKVMEPALPVGTKAWLDPAVYPKAGHEVLVFGKAGNAWLGRLVSLEGDRAEIENSTGRSVITDVQAVHVVVLSERI